MGKENQVERMKAESMKWYWEWAVQHLCVKEDDTSHSGLDPRGGAAWDSFIHNSDISIQAWVELFLLLYLDYNGKMLVLTKMVATSTMIGGTWFVEGHNTCPFHEPGIKTK